MRKPFAISAGFTLIEIIIAISLLAILLTGGVASFISYNQAQSLNTAALDVFTMLNKAKSRTQSQVKPDICINQSRSLDGYSVVISPLTKTYTLNAVCTERDVLIESKALPDNISFNTRETTKTQFLFQVISGSILGGGKGAGTVAIDGYGQTKAINVDELGNISIN